MRLLQRTASPRNRGAVGAADADVIGVRVRASALPSGFLTTDARRSALAGFYHTSLRSP